MVYFFKKRLIFIYFIFFSDFIETKTINTNQYNYDFLFLK